MIRNVSFHELSSPLSFLQVKPSPAWNVYEEYIISKTAYYVNENPFQREETYDFDALNGDTIQATTAKKRPNTENKGRLSSFLNLDVSKSEKIIKWVNTYGLLTNDISESLSLFQEKHQELSRLYKLFDMTMPDREEVFRDNVKILPFYEYLKSLPSVNGVVFPGGPFPPDGLSLSDCKDLTKEAIIIDGCYFMDYIEHPSYGKNLVAIVAEYIAEQVSSQISKLTISYDRIVHDNPDGTNPYRLVPCLYYPYQLIALYWEFFLYLSSDLTEMKRCHRCNHLFQLNTGKEKYCPYCRQKYASQNAYATKKRAAIREWKETHSLEQAAHNNNFSVSSLEKELLRQGLLSKEV